MSRKPSAPKPSASAGRSLDALDPISPADLGRRPPSKAVAAARAVPLKDLSPAALLTLLHDGRGLRHLLPFAAEAAALDPWAEREFHRGDLLLAVLQTRSPLHPAGTKLRAALVALATAALATAKRLPPAQRAPDLEAEVIAWLAKNGRG